MFVLDTIKDTVNAAVGTISNVTQSLIEKNKTNAKLNRLRFIMKNESELMNRAYIALGKQYYEMQKTGNYEPTETQEKLFALLESSKKKLARARECYRKIVDSQNDIFYGNADESTDNEIETGKIVDITVACSNENEYKSSPFAAEESAADENEEVQTEAEIEIKAEAEDSVADENAAEDAEDSELTEEELF